MTHLSEDELEWVKGPAKYETGIFESDYKEGASYSRDFWNISNATSHIYLNSNIEKGGQWEYEAWSKYFYSVNLPKYKTKLSGFFEARKSLKNDSLIFECEFNERLSTNKQPLKIQDVEIRGKRFNNCIIIDSLNSEYQSNSKSISYPVCCYIISKKYGLIYFKLESGEEYYRKFHEVTDTIQRH
ncbi:MAG: hypothetical protein HDS72_00315 [Bacteroidales bacterium]|nr:hypothetical protein [Bacteroidales bacterium]